MENIKLTKGDIESLASNRFGRKYKWHIMGGLVAVLAVLVALMVIDIRVAPEEPTPVEIIIVSRVAVGLLCLGAVLLIVGVLKAQRRLVGLWKGGKLDVELPPYEERKK